MKALRLLLSIIITFYCFNVGASVGGNQLPLALKKQLLSGDYKQAASQLSILAKHKNSEAQYQLALLYLRGKGVEKLLSIAEKLLIQSANSNDKASLLLGKLYVNGDVFTKNRVKANIYLRLAKNQGNRKASIYLKKYFKSGNDLNKTIQTQLITAVQKGNIAVMRTLLQQGGKLNLMDDQDNSLLMIAIKARQSKMALWILSQLKRSSKKHSGLNQQNKQMNTALHEALIAKMQEVAIILIRKNININLVNSVGESALILAIKLNNKAVAQKLINEKANVNTHDKFGYTANYYVNKEGMKLVFPYHKNSKSLAIMSEKQKQRMLSILKRQSYDTKSPYYQCPALMIAIAQDQKNIIEYLLKKRVDPWLENLQGDNAISFAIKRKKISLALKLIKIKTANVTKTQWLSLIKLAIIQGNLSLFKTLYKYLGYSKQSVKSANNQDNFSIENTPMNFAIEYNQHAIFMEIYRNTLFSSIMLGKYLLHSTKLNRTNFSLLLIDKSADLRVLDKKQHDALWYAIETENIDTVLLLLKSGANLVQFDMLNNSPLMRAVLKNNNELVSILLQYGADPERKSPTQNNALLFAAQDRLSILKLFLKNKPNINIRNKQSYTPLMLAVKSKCTGCVKVLMAAGANPNRKNEHGENSFYLARDNSEILSVLTNK